MKNGGVVEHMSSGVFINTIESALLFSVSAFEFWDCAYLCFYRWCISGSTRKALEDWICSCPRWWKRSMQNLPLVYHSRYPKTSIYWKNRVTRLLYWSTVLARSSKNSVSAASERSPCGGICGQWNSLADIWCMEPLQVHQNLCFVVETELALKLWTFSCLTELRYKIADAMKNHTQTRLSSKFENKMCMSYLEREFPCYNTVPIVTLPSQSRVMYSCSKISDYLNHL